MSGVFLCAFANTLPNCCRYVMHHYRGCIVLTGSQKIDGKLSFATDAWTSPNHKAYIAVTVHYEINGAPNALLLDLVELLKSHTGENLAIAFAEVLDAFGIKDKVSLSNAS